MRDSIARAFAAGVVTGALVTAGSIFCLGQAHADTETYLADISSAGIPPGTVKAELTVGAEICALMGSGVGIAEVVRRAVDIAGLTPISATSIATIAVRDLCPQYAPTGPAHTPSTIT